jgi:hypothetical protein
VKADKPKGSGKWSKASVAISKSFLSASSDTQRKFEVWPTKAKAENANVAQPLQPEQGEKQNE